MAWATSALDWVGCTRRVAFIWAVYATEVTEASGIVADVAQLTTGHASQRIAQRITDLRGLLTPWKRTKPVRELDERLAAYRPAVESSSKL